MAPSTFQTSSPRDDLGWSGAMEMLCTVGLVGDSMIVGNAEGAGVAKRRLAEDGSAESTLVVSVDELAHCGTFSERFAQLDAYHPWAPA